MNQLPRSFRSTHALAAAGLLKDSTDDVARVAERYAVAITPDVAALINPADPNDPIARQFLPDARELVTHPRELADPISDHAKSPVKGIVHRYPNRVLLKIASVCPVYCRFCFRREMVGPALGEAMSPKDLATALAYIREHKEIAEVILTGGDPLVLAPERIRSVTEALGDIGHVEILRWHTRVPVVDPARVTNDVTDALNASAKVAVVALHINHPRELTLAARAAISRFRVAGIPMLSQTVLLKGVNDNAETLEELLHDLVNLDVKPYYLHHGDLAPGTAHFRTTIVAGLDIMRSLRSRLPIEALPRYVLDIPGGFGKVDIEMNVHAVSLGRYIVHDANGGMHHYDDV